MRTVKIKSMRAGGYCPTHPDTQPGPETMTYAITGVPVDVDAGQVSHQLQKVTLAHQLDDPAGWQYNWSEIADRRRGTIINLNKPVLSLRSVL